MSSVINGDDGFSSAFPYIAQIVESQDGEVATGTTIMPLDDTIPQITEGDEYLSVTITPKKATNKLIVEVGANFSHSSTSSVIMIALFKDAIANAVAAKILGRDGAVNAVGSASMIFSIIAGGVVPITFSVRAGSGVAGTTTFNGAGGGRYLGGVLNSYIRVIEVNQ